MMVRSMGLGLSQYSQSLHETIHADKTSFDSNPKSIPWRFHQDTIRESTGLHVYGVYDTCVSVCLCVCVYVCAIVTVGYLLEYTVHCHQGCPTKPHTRLTYLLVISTVIQQPCEFQIRRGVPTVTLDSLTGPKKSTSLVVYSSSRQRPTRTCTIHTSRCACIAPSWSPWKTSAVCRVCKCKST